MCDCLKLWCYFFQAAGSIVSPRHMVDDAEFWGAVAYAVSRDGMRTLLDRYWHGWDAELGRGVAESSPKTTESPQCVFWARTIEPHRVCSDLCFRTRYIHRQAVVTPPFDDPELPFLDLTENPLSDIIAYVFVDSAGGCDWSPDALLTPTCDSALSDTRRHTLMSSTVLCLRTSWAKDPIGQKPIPQVGYIDTKTTDGGCYISSTKVTKRTWQRTALKTTTLTTSSNSPTCGSSAFLMRRQSISFTSWTHWPC